MNAAPPILVMPVEVTAVTVVTVEAEAIGLLDGTGARLVVDLGSVSFMSSAGLGFLVRVGKAASERGGAVALARPTGSTLRLLKAVGLDEVLPRFASVAEATAWVRRGGA